MKGLDSLEGRFALVTGGTSAMGVGIAQALLDKGAGVFLADLDLDKLARTRDELLALCPGADVGFARLDLLEPGCAAAAFAAALAHFPTIDILVNNAGLCRIHDVADLTNEHIDATFGVNVKGLLDMSKLFAAELIAQGKRGNIVNIASNAGKITFSGQLDYCASKAAVINITQSLAKEWAPQRINVNAVCPGAVDTDMLRYCMEDAVARSGGTLTVEDCRETWGAEQLGRLVEPVEIGRVVAFLASDSAVVIRGQSINVDAGTTPY
ncbi:MAG: SDR family oxidoreductase [Oscillospiraceae bacterium]|nr:SDR family oxidoreductase [Oscillospiraceae bacterium]